MVKRSAATAWQKQRRVPKMRHPFCFMAANHARPGASLPETDPLTFLQEELLSPIQRSGRVYTLFFVVFWLFFAQTRGLESSLPLA